jgi:hypothetical protein
MVGKRESLRQGKAVELEPGVQGKLNFEDQTLELSDGRKLAISRKDKRDLFPSSEEGRKYAQEREKVQRNIKENPYGEFLHQFGQKGIIGGIKNWGDKLTHTGEEYLRKKRAEQEVGQEISEESPWTSGAATVASFVPDIALTGGMSAARAAPLIAGLSAGPRIIEEPLEVAGEAAIAAAGGKFLDKTGKYLSNVASRRAASREIPVKQAQVRAQNIAGEAETTAYNAQQKQAFNALKERNANENAAVLHQHNLALNERQNRMIQAKNSYEQAKANRESEIFRLENEYKTAKAERSANAERLESEYKQARATAEQETKRLNDEYQVAQKQYQESLRDIPRLQKEAQDEHSRNVLKNVADIEKSFPKDSRIVGKQIGAQEFIDEAINTTGLAGSREGAQASRVLKSIFPENDLLTAKELSKRYQAIEDAIKRASPEVQSILNQFKTHLGERLPLILEDSVVFSKIMPSLEKRMEKEIPLILKDIPWGKGEETTKNMLISKANANLKQMMRQIGSEDFVHKLESGEISRLFRDGILTTEDFLNDKGFTNFSKLRKQGLYEYAERAINDKHQFFANEIQKRIDNALARSEIKAIQSGRTASKKLGKDVRKTYGLAEPVATPVAPSAPANVPMPIAPVELPPIGAPQIPSPLIPPQTPQMPFKPPLAAEPASHTPRSFSAQPEPVLGGAVTGAEKMGDFLEKPLLKGKGTPNHLLKLGALKYALGKAALPLEAAGLASYGGLKALTSPGVGGQAARLSFKQAGIQAIEALAQKYPSYKNGIIQSPQERRSLTKEIEDDHEIPIEQKALLQSKINRGKPLQERLM